MENDKAAGAMPAGQPAAERAAGVTAEIVDAATSELPIEQRDAVRWLYAHGSAEDLSLADLAGKIGYDQTTLSRLFRGQYAGSLRNVCKAIADYRQLHEQRTIGRQPGFIETGLTRRVGLLCQAALEWQRISYFFGDSQTGKTFALLAWHGRHSEQSIYLRCPTGGALGLFIKDLARALKLSPALREDQLRHRVIAGFNPQRLLIIDEAHQCFLAKGMFRGVRTIEFIREIHDVAQCGIVICGTNVFKREMEEGSVAGYLQQCRRRRLAILQLPATPPARELEPFAAAYGLPPAAGEALALQSRAVAEEGLGWWIVLLRMAVKSAAKKKEKPTWDHVLDVAQKQTRMEGE